MFIQPAIFRLATLLLLILFSCSSVAAEKTLQLLARYDTTQPALQLAEPIPSGFRNKVLKVAVAGQPQPPLYMDTDKRRFEGLSADYLSLIQSMLDTTIELYHYPSHSAAQNAVINGEMQMLAINVVLPSSQPQPLLASVPWMLDYSVVGHKPDHAINLNHTLAQRVAWSGPPPQREYLENIYQDDHLVRFPGYYDAVAAVVFDQTGQVWGNAATLNHLNRYLFAHALKVAPDEQSIPMDVSFGISPQLPKLADAINQALQQIPLSIRMQIAKRWQLDAHHVLQSNPLALTQEEEQWLKEHPRIDTSLSTVLAPLSSRTGNMPFRGMTVDVLELITNLTGMSFIAHGQEDDPPTSSSDMLPSLFPLEILEREDEKHPQLTTRPWLVSHWVIIRNQKPRSIIGQDTFPFGSALMLSNQVMKEWMLQHYPNLNLTPVDDPVDALRQLQDHKVDAVVLPKIFADYLLRNHFGDRLNVESTLGAEPARFVMRATPGNELLISILNKALLAIPPETLFKLLAQWRQAETPFLSASWQNYKQAVLIIVSVSAGLILLILFWNHHLRKVIQQRIQAENALKNQLNFTHTLFNESPVAMYIRDKKTRLVDCNQAYLRFMNFRRDEVIGKRLSDVLTGNNESIHSIEDGYQQTLLDGEAVIRDIHMALDHQAYQLYHWTLPFRDRLGDVAGVIGGWLDVTERNALLQELQLAKDAADKANRSKSEFLASMSHEIRTPLHAIIGLLELETRSHAADSLSENIRVAYSSAHALLSLIGDVLDLSKIESGLYQPTLETVYLPDVIEQAVALFRNKAESKGLDLRVEMDIAAYWVKTDPLMINQILSNLLSNAIKFTEEGTVTVVLMQGIAQEEEGSEFVIEVSDNGCGMTEDQQHAIFEPFVQVGDRHQQQLGTGLGLSICRNLAHLLDGELIVESAPGEGAVFSFYFRAAQGEPRDQTQPHLSQPPLSDKLSVLVIDDHAPNRLLLGKQLEMSGHQVVVSESAAEALALWQQEPLRFDLIITDCNMPSMNGFQFAEALRQYEQQYQLPPIMLFGLTASAEQHIMQRCLQAGMNDCLFKPLNLDRLLAKIAQCIHRGPDDARQNYAAADERERINEVAVTEAVGSDSALFPPFLIQLAERDAESCRALLTSIRTSHDELLRELQQTQEASTLSQLGHKLKGGAAILNAHALMKLGRQLEVHREEAYDAQALIQQITLEIGRVNQTLFEFAVTHLKNQ
ncbi:diguanylate cyclase [Pantoea sp. RIT-PI-b]|uniref:ATP-binding protein n=1 Tax=Pantoea sp. RIT-PI-b TaxID=1681195 RepID=UPI000676840A|nr:ATP-binding protein [Pantoea sp. RIT-PI-b]KNC17435.1 diguanylate cyclase [Pantoea sp. RIT-PI-b]